MEVDKIPNSFKIAKFDLNVLWQNSTFHTYRRTPFNLLQPFFDVNICEWTQQGERIVVLLHRPSSQLKPTLPGPYRASVDYHTGCQSIIAGV